MEQIQISYQPVHDRLLLKITNAADTFDIWLTRRYVILLLPQLQKVVENDPIVSEQKNNPNQQEIMNFQREQSQVQHKVHQSQDKIAPERPDVEPFLAEGVGIDKQVLHIHFTNKKKLSIRLNTSMAYSIINLIEAALVKTGWGFTKVKTKPKTQQPAQAKLNRVSFDIN